MAEIVDQRLSHHRAAGIARAQNQYFLCIRLHQSQHPVVFLDGAQQSGVFIVSGVQQACSA